jgi:hypothetical protein
MYVTQASLEPKGLQGSHLIKEIQNGLLIHTHSVGTLVFGLPSIQFLHINYDVLFCRLF